MTSRVGIASAIALLLTVSFAGISSAAEGSGGKMVFSLLPKSFQKNPRLDFNVRTEMTPQGRARGMPTAANPAYYVPQITAAESRGFTTVDITRNAPKEEQVQKLVENALRADNYLPAVDGGPKPTAVMIIHWGYYSNPAFNGEEESDGSGGSAEAGRTARELMPLVLGSIPKRKAIIDRAALIGGAAFAKELNDVLNQEAHQEAAASVSDVGRQAAVAGTEAGTDEVSSMLTLLNASSPLALYMSKDQKIADMVEEVFSDSYYVVVSAIDYASVAQGHPILLWRTKLSLNAIGVNLGETIPPMVAIGTDYFGRETEKTQTITKRIMRGGHVDIGEAKVLDYVEPNSKPTPKPAPESQKQ